MDETGDREVQQEKEFAEKITAAVEASAAAAAALPAYLAYQRRKNETSQPAFNLALCVLREVLGEGFCARTTNSDSLNPSLAFVAERASPPGK